MRIAYLVLTCEKFAPRVEWQRRTMFRDIPEEDIYYLGHKSDEANRMFSWGAPDDYRNLPYKYHDCFKYKDITGYDWYILLDDDSYVYHDTLRNLLSLYREDRLICIGHQLHHLGHTKWGSYMSGGAGTVLSAPLYRAICQYVRANPPGEVVRHWCADICISLWVKEVEGSHFIHSEQFHADTYDPKKHRLEMAVTFHHLKKEEDFESYQWLKRGREATM